MIPEIGHFCLLLALGLAVLQVGLLCFHLIDARVARTLTLGQCFWITFGLITLMYAFWQDDFSVAYVAKHSNSALPLGYKISALWSAHEGSMLLWIWILSLWSVAVVKRGANLPAPILVRTLATLSVLQIGFLLFLLHTSNPFLRHWIGAPLEGQDLNPLLQDLGLILHPPLLYVGYIGFAVPFAVAIAVLLKGHGAIPYVVWAQPFVLLAWICLTIGIVLGSWWAYYELGWGGWWFWDPVENASFMPWLAGTALLHTFHLVRKKQQFHEWWLFLAIATFSLSLLGAFLVRSGILVSVHSFASDPERGYYLLIFLSTTVGVSGALFLYRLCSWPWGFAERLVLFSKESFLLMQNMLLMVLCGTVLLGTVFPMAYEAVTAQKISVGFPYFNQVFVPLFIPMLLLMIVLPHATWLKNTLSDKKNRVLGFGALGLLVGLGASYGFTPTEPGWASNLKVCTGVTLGVWLILSTLIARASTKRGHLGMTAAHVGMALCVLGITLNTQYGIERELKIKVGDEIVLKNNHIRFVGLGLTEGGNYVSHQATFTVNGRPLHPEKRVFTAHFITMTETAIDVTWLRDIYIALGERLDGHYWSARIYYKPCVRWIWAGGLLMALGGVLTLTKPKKEAKPL